MADRKGIWPVKTCADVPKGSALEQVEAEKRRELADPGSSEKRLSMEVLLVMVPVVATVATAVVVISVDGCIKLRDTYLLAAFAHLFVS